MPVSRSSALGSKRKAQEGLPESQAQKPRLVQADCAFDQCWHETDLQRPGLISIQAILRNHHRRRLYVRPIAWVADHLRLLECYFRRIGSGGNCEESRLKASRKGESYHDTGDVSSRMSDDFPRRRLVENKEAILAAGRLCRPTSLAVKKLAVETILGTFNNIPLP
ncbi:hypothetical protein BDV25DRAFT_135638 [Aspergillus avenaceus]|uniref:Uncharacterized protein n=1 Tax=Aspergillus avenaceus TaxID=36643 RepID=A0A5N6U7X9_ASPAV|nr:hypothetical protein BDV25DRAFT_135638 [Aspergillus avenaceus]